MKPVYSFTKLVNEEADPVEDALRSLRLAIQREQGPYLTDVLRDLIDELRNGGQKKMDHATDALRYAVGATGTLPKKRRSAGRARQIAAMKAYWRKRKAGKK